MSPPDVKRCSTCGVVKPRTQYARRASAIDKRQAECKACNATRRRGAPLIKRNEEAPRPVEVSTLERAEERIALKGAIRELLEPMFDKEQP